MGAADQIRELRAQVTGLGQDVAELRGVCDAMLERMAGLEARLDERDDYGREQGEHQE